MRSLKFTVDHLPDPDLSPNSRVHWAVKARAVKAFRQEAGWLAKTEWHEQPPMQVARISYDFYLPTNRRRDADNLLAMCKPLQDGLIDANVIFYDDAQHLQIGHVVCSKGTAGSITITVQEVS